MDNIETRPAPPASDAPAPPPAPPDDDRGTLRDYKALATIKLESAIRRETTVRSHAFQGLTILVTGNTTPSPETLVRIVNENGGFATAVPRGPRTHIVAENVTTRLQEIVAETKAPPFIVTPQWVLDCARTSSRVSEGPYLIQSGILPTAPLFRAGAPPPRPPRAIASPGSHDVFDIASYHAASRKAHIGGARYKLQALVARALASATAGAGASAGAGAGAGAGGHEGPPSLPGWKRVIAHVDINAFFVAVSLLAYPEYRGKPIVVAHTSAPGAPLPPPRGGGAGAGPGAGEGAGAGVDGLSAGSRGAEIACASYEARDFGICAGMGVNSARAKCPDLVVLPYDFARIDATSTAVMLHLTRIACGVAALEVVSCDEACLDLSGCGGGACDPLAALRALRSEIEATLGVTVSIGVAPNRLLAKMACGLAKPLSKARVTKDTPAQCLPGRGTGLCILDAPSAALLFATLPVRELHGVGYAMGSLLSDNGLATVADVARAPVHVLQRLLGKEKGAILSAHAHGIDHTPVVTHVVRQSVSTEVTWGVRLADIDQAVAFIDKLAHDLAERLACAGEEAETAANVTRLPGEVAERVCARVMTMRLMIRAAGAGESFKHPLGHGMCDTMTKTEALHKPTSDGHELSSTAKSLLRKLLKAHPTEIRGMGLSVRELSHSRFPAAPLAEGAGSILSHLLPRQQSPGGVGKKRPRDGAQGKGGGASIHAGDGPRMSPRGTDRSSGTGVRAEGVDIMVEGGGGGKEGDDSDGDVVLVGETSASVVARHVVSAGGVGRVVMPLPARGGMRKRMAIAPPAAPLDACVIDPKALEALPASMRADAVRAVQQDHQRRLGGWHVLLPQLKGRRGVGTLRSGGNGVSGSVVPHRPTACTSVTEHAGVPIPSAKEAPLHTLAPSEPLLRSLGRLLAGVGSGGGGSGGGGEGGTGGGDGISLLSVLRDVPPLTAHVPIFKGIDEDASEGWSLDPSGVAGLHVSLSDPSAAFAALLRTWVVSVGPAPSPSHEALLTAFCIDSIRSSRCSDASILVRALTRVCEEMDEGGGREMGLEEDEATLNVVGAQASSPWKGALVRLCGAVGREAREWLGVALVHY